MANLMLSMMDKLGVKATAWATAGPDRLNGLVELKSRIELGP